MLSRVQHQHTKCKLVCRPKSFFFPVPGSSAAAVIAMSRMLPCSGAVHSRRITHRTPLSLSSSRICKGKGNTSPAVQSQTSRNKQNVHIIVCPLRNSTTFIHLLLSTQTNENISFSLCSVNARAWLIQFKVIHCLHNSKEQQNLFFGCPEDTLLLPVSVNGHGW